MEKGWVVWLGTFGFLLAIITSASAGMVPKEVFLNFYEPATMGILGFGMTAAAFIARRRSLRK
jgi:hypothetical protein